MSNKDLGFVKTTKETSLFYLNYNINALQHFSKGEFLALQNLHRNKNIVIIKCDKSDFFIIVKACVQYFLSTFYFSPNDNPSKL